jgi:Phage major capsid protein E
MPVSTDFDYLYDTATILAATTNIPSAPTFLKQQLFGIDETTPATAFSSTATGATTNSRPLSPSANAASRCYASRSPRAATRHRSSPRSKDLRADDLMKRTPGEAAFTRMSGSEREAYWLSLDWTDLDTRIARRIEWQIAQLLFMGKITASDADDKKVISEIDYGTPESVAITTKWDQASRDPHADLRNAMRHLTSVCYAQADLIVLGKNAANAYVKNQAVIDGFNKFWVKSGEMKPKEKSLGVSQLSTWMGLPVYSYELAFTDDDGVEKHFVPDDMVLVASTAIKHKVAYAGVSQVDPVSKRMDVFEGTRVPQVYYSEEDDCRYFRLSSRPCPVPADMLGWVIMDAI